MSFVKTLTSIALCLAASLAFANVEVNKASQAELESVKGIGPSMSGRILDARRSRSFNDWHDLQSRVKGIGDAKALKLSTEGLMVNGGAFKAVSPKPAESKKAARASEKPSTDKATKTPKA